MELLIAYIIVGYFWSLMCMNRSVELNYPRKLPSLIIAFFMNVIFWPMSMVMGYRLERYLTKNKPNNWR